MLNAEAEERAERDALLRGIGKRWGVVVGPAQRQYAERDPEEAPAWVNAIPAN